MEESEQQTGDRFFRRVIGYLCVAGSMIGFIALYFVEVPPGNDKAMMFALGIVFGWGSMVVSSEYGVTSTGRKVAESAIRKIERAEIVSESAPTGTPSDPLSVAGATNAPPVDVKETSHEKNT